MPQYRAAWLLPITLAPIRDAWLLTERGRIVAFGPSRPGDATPLNEIDLGQVAIVPGLVNAHTHLELSWLRGRVPQTNNFPQWIRAVVALIHQTREHAAEAASAIEAAIDEARRYGTALIGDISNGLVTSRPLAGRGLAALVFHELIGFRTASARNTLDEAVKRLAAMPCTGLLRHSLAPHAPYSVSPALFGAIRTVLQGNPVARSSVHLGESRAEIQFLRDGSGPWRQFLEEVTAWDPSWVPPKCGPVEYLDRMGFIDERLLVIHGVQLTAGELKRLASTGATLVTCPRGNVRTGAGEPPISGFYRSGVRIAVGTDSLASVPDLNIFAELAEMRRLAPDVPAKALLESATIHGARALGFEADFGSIEAGKRDRLLAVDVPEQLTDIEAYLVSGVEPSRVHWLEASES